MLLTTNMFMTKTKGLLAAQREASRKVAQGKSYSVDLPIVGRVPVPPPEQLAIYAALGGLAVLELIDWPVALALGVGSALVSRHLSELENRGEECAEAIEPVPEDTPKPSTAKARRSTPRPATAGRAPAKKAAVPKPPAQKAPAQKDPAKKVAAKKVAAKKVAAAAKKVAAKKATAKKPVAKKAAAKKPPTNK